MSEKGLQEKVNVELMKMADDLDIRCVLTSDSHYGAKEDFDTYLKMHEIKNTKPEYIEHVKIPMEIGICQNRMNSENVS